MLKLSYFNNAMICRSAEKVVILHFQSLIIHFLFMKKFYTFLAISAIIAASAFALTPQLRNTAKAPERVRVAKERPKKNDHVRRTPHQRRH